MFKKIQKLTKILLFIALVFVTGFLDISEPVDASVRNDMVDVSSYQGNISVDDYQAMRQNGVRAITIKATEGTQYVNPYLNVQYTNATKAGLATNFYHFSRYTNTQEAQAEAQHFANTVSSVTNQRMGVMVNDLESNEIGQNTLQNNQVNNLAFVSTLNNHGYQNTDSYSMASWFNHKMDVVLNQKAWVASYFSNPKLGMFQNANAWQWSSNKTFAEIPGKVFDISHLYTNFYLSSLASNVSSAKSTFDNTNNRNYVVKSGDCVWLIGLRNHVNYRDILRVNNLNENSLIYPGESLTLPIQ